VVAFYPIARILSDRVSQSLDVHKLRATIEPGDFWADCVSWSKEKQFSCLGNHLRIDVHLIEPRFARDALLYRRRPVDVLPRHRRCLPVHSKHDCFDDSRAINRDHFCAVSK
jgi:hypothetical protein